MTIAINQGPRLHKHIRNNVYTTRHKNLIKDFNGENKKKNKPLSQNGSNYKTPKDEPNQNLRSRRGFYFNQWKL